MKSNSWGGGAFYQIELNERTNLKISYWNEIIAFTVYEVLLLQSHPFFPQWHIEIWMRQYRAKYRYCSQWIISKAHLIYLFWFLCRINNRIWGGRLTSVLPIKKKTDFFPIYVKLVGRLFLFEMLTVDFRCQNKIHMTNLPWPFQSPLLLS